MKAETSELEQKIDFMNARLLNTSPEKQEKAKKQLLEYYRQYFACTGRRYVPDIQRRKYDEGDY